MDRKTLLIGGGVLVFAITLAIITGTQLNETSTQAVGFGVGIGITAGMISGGVVSWLILRRLKGQATGTGSMSGGGFNLSEEQVEILFALLEEGVNRRQADPEKFPLRGRRREFSGVGGADVPDYEDGE